MTKFKYYHDINEIDRNGFVIEVSKDITTTKCLLSELNNKLLFPKYFEYNWDALFDCLRDFSWIKENSIIIIHTEVPQLNLEELKVYFKILQSSVDDWNNHEEHELIIYFLDSEIQKIKENL